MQCPRSREVNRHPKIPLARQKSILLAPQNWILVVTIVAQLALSGCTKPKPPETKPEPTPPAKERPAQSSPRSNPIQSGNQPPAPIAKQPLPEIPRPAPPAKPLPENPRALQQRYFSADSTPEERSEIIRILGTNGTTEAVDVLRIVFGAEKRLELRMEVLEVATDLDIDRNREGKVAILTLAVAPTQPQLMRLSALQALAGTEDRRVLPLLRQLSLDPDAEIRSDATEIIEDLER